MRSRDLAVAIALVTVLAAGPAPAAVTAYFSPTDSIHNVWISQIAAAKVSIHTQEYVLSDSDYEVALAAAAQRGVEVTIITDRTEAGNYWMLLKTLVAASPNVRVIVKHSSTLMHAKFGIFDGLRLVEGSFNLSGDAQKEDNHIVLWAPGPADAAVLQPVITAFEAEWERVFLRETGVVYGPGAPSRLAPITNPPPGHS